MPSPSKSPRLLAAATALALAFATGRADAFCRSVTCRSTEAKPCATDANGCGTSGHQLFWKTSCIQFNLQRSGTQQVPIELARKAITRSFQAWSAVDCGGGKQATITFSPGEDVSCRISQYNTKAPNVNVVFFQDDNWKYRGVDGTLAKTSVTYNDDTGEIYDADIEVNSANNLITVTDDAAATKYDLQAILTHEVGHFIGIAHTQDASATMFPSYSPGSVTQRVLAPDDKKAACAAYPPDRTATCDATPRGGFSGTCGDTSGAGSSSSSSGCAVAAGPAGGPGDASPAGGASIPLVLGALGLAWLIRPGSRKRQAASTAREIVR